MDSTQVLYIKNIKVPQSTKPTVSLQDVCLEFIQKEGNRVSLFLISGIRLAGRITSFDKHNILLDCDKYGPQLVSKHAIASIMLGEDFQ